MQGDEALPIPEDCQSRLQSKIAIIGLFKQQKCTETHQWHLIIWYIGLIYGEMVKFMVEVP